MSNNFVIGVDYLNVFKRFQNGSAKDSIDDPHQRPSFKRQTLHVNDTFCII